VLAPCTSCQLSTRPCTNLACCFITWGCRWLNNEQALEDSANFMRNVKFEGIDEDLTARNTPWIYYGVRVLSLPSRCSGHLTVNDVSRRGRMQEHEPLICESSTLISCLVLLRRVVRTTALSSFHKRHLPEQTSPVPSGDARCAHELGVHGCHPARRRPKVLLQPREHHRHH
jgi:hypothetical protein